MNPGFHIIIPARYHSSRLPGKLMMSLGSKTVLQRVYEQALLARPLSVLIATDHEDIKAHARSFGAVVMMTSPEHQCGSERIAEVVSQGHYQDDDIIVNVQGDEPFIAPELIQQVANNLHHSSVPVSTLCWPIENQEQLLNPNIVKLVRNHLNHALYFSRSPIPYHREKPNCIDYAFRHIGLYAYRASFLLQYVSWEKCRLEEIELLEQLRILWAGYAIHVDKACVPPKMDINTEKDLHEARLYCME